MSKPLLPYIPRFKKNPCAFTLDIPAGHARLFQSIVNQEKGTGSLMVAYCETSPGYIGTRKTLTPQQANEELLPVFQLLIHDPASIDVYITGLQKLKAKMLLHQQDAPHDTQTNQG